MYELSESEYFKVVPFLDNIANEIVFARSIIEKKQVGRIFVDDVNNPNVSLICHYCGLGILSGSTEIDSFNKMLVGILYNRIESSPRNLRMIVNSDRWKEKMDELFGDKIVYYSSFENSNEIEYAQRIKKLSSLSSDHIVAWTRVKFKLVKEQFAHISDNFNIPNGFTLKEIDEDIIGKIKGSIVPGFSWNSNEAFLKNGIGYCLVDGDSIISTSFSAFVSEDKIDIGIETNPDYRGKGFGLLTGAAMVGYCIKNGFEPVWCCRKDNIGSFSLAKKLGFEDIIEHPLYCSINK